MEVGVILVGFWYKISQPLDGIIWLFVVSSFFTNLSLLNNRIKELTRSCVTFPDYSKLGDEVLYDGAKPGMEES